MSEKIKAIQSVPLPAGNPHRASRWNRFAFDCIEPVKAFVRTVLKASDVSEIARRSGLASAGIVAVLVVKDEAPRLPFLLGYYRGIGVEHFVVVDNRSTDDVRDLLLAEPDVSLFTAEGNFGESRFGNDWVNGLLRRYCVDKWVLWIDADELLVFSDRPGARLRELVAELDRRGQESLQTIMLDMYSDGSPHENIVGTGVDPRSVCDLYDRSGYVSHSDLNTGATWIKGGVRGRLFFPDVWSGPALNKTPLVRWRRHYAFLKVAHELWPRQLNGRGRVEGVLLHFKFTATSVEKMVDAAMRKQHTAEYEAYSDMSDLSFVSESTARLVDARGLVDDGLFEPIV